jgi:hypothetical protein
MATGMMFSFACANNSKLKAIHVLRYWCTVFPVHLPMDCSMDKQYAKEKRKICPSIIEFIENHDSQFFNQGREILVREKNCEMPIALLHSNNR